MSALSVPIFAFGLAGSPSAGISAASDVVVTQMLAAHTHFREAVTRTTVDQRVAQLAETWRRERGYSSSLSDMILMSSYQQIIGLGREAIPAIVRELRARPDHWFWALQVISGVNPVPESSEGRVKEMAKAWMAWAQAEGILA